MTLANGHGAVDGPLLNQDGASQLLLSERGIAVAPKTLQKLRCVGGGPKYRKFGNGRVYYAPAEIHAWADQQLSELLSSTSELPAPVRRITRPAGG